MQEVARIVIEASDSDIETNVSLGRRTRHWLGWMPVLVFILWCGTPASAADLASERASSASTPATLSSLRTFLVDPNSRAVLFGTALLGVSAGLVGVFLVLRGNALVGDVVGHATLPGLALAFLIMEMIGPGSGKWIPGLLAGAFLSGLAGAGAMLFLDRRTSLKADCVQAVVLSVFYGFGSALLSVIQQLPGGNSAGLKDYLTGKSATLVSSDVFAFAVVAVMLVVLTVLVFKELTLVAFDAEYATAGGWPVRFLDALMMLIIVGVTVLGLQSVGLVLVVAALIIPATAARFWTNDIRLMAVIAALIGAGSSIIGVMISSSYAKVAAGPAIVLSGSFLFLLSFAFGRERGLVLLAIQRSLLGLRMDRQHLLRGIYEILERRNLLESNPPAPVAWAEVGALRPWSGRRLTRLFTWAAGQNFVTGGREGLALTPDGRQEAERLVRNHRLWELYLLQYADAAAERVDRDADEIEHLLDAEMIRELEARLDQQDQAHPPASPHAIGPGS
jgi:manganese/zinc/iron transport system permease protein